MNPKVDFFFNKDSKWQKCYQLLRSMALHCGLTEELKWGKPCYTINGGNVVLIHGFKDYCALLFHKGALLQDQQKILVQQTENVQAARQLRFTNSQQVIEQEAIIKDYLHEAAEIEKKGLQVELKKTADYDMPSELLVKLQENPELEKAFYNLTPGRQRGYLLYFSQAKQSKTRAGRVEKYTPQILNGKGLND